MRPLPLPGPRKDAILRYVPKCAVAADIGADHGITAAHLLKSGRCASMVVTDISAASLEKARRLFTYHDLLADATFTVADGLKALAAPVDAIIISGMSAFRIIGILQEGMAQIGDAALVLQPSMDSPALRRWLCENGFLIAAETVVCEDGRYYVLLRAIRGAASYTEKEIWLGPVLLRERPAIYRQYLVWLRSCLTVVRSEEARRAIEWIEEEVDLPWSAP